MDIGGPVSTPIDGATFRRVLGHYPTGVCVITATQGDGRPVAMVVGSFTSVSLAPPLVAFFPARRSRSWPKIARAGRFCVNVLAKDQQDLCRRFSARGMKDFSDVAHRLSGGGAPIIDGVIAWIDCAVEAVHEAGDHFVVLGRVEALGVERAGEPLVFLRGGYGAFAAME